MKVYEIWLEGYAATGNRGTARYLGSSAGRSFKDACRRALISAGSDLKNYYDPVKNTYWGCNFYDNEADARKYFG